MRIFSFFMILIWAVILPGCLTKNESETSTSLTDVLSGTVNVSQLENAVASLAPQRTSDETGSGDSGAAVELIDESTGNVIAQNEEFAENSNGCQKFHFSGSFKGKKLRMRLNYGSQSYDCYLGSYPADSSSVDLSEIDMADETIASAILEESISADGSSSSQNGKNFDVRQRYAIKTLIQEIVANLSEDDMKDILSNITGISVEDNGKVAFEKPGYGKKEVMPEPVMGIREIWAGGAEDRLNPIYIAPYMDVRKISETSVHIGLPNSTYSENSQGNAFRKREMKYKNNDVPVPAIASSERFSVYEDGVAVAFNTSDFEYENTYFEAAMLRIYSEDGKIYFKVLVSDSASLSEPYTVNAVISKRNASTTEKDEFELSFVSKEENALLFSLCSDEWLAFFEQESYYYINIEEFSGTAVNIESEFFVTGEKPSVFVPFEKIVDSAVVYSADKKVEIYSEGSLTQDIKKIAAPERLELSPKTGMEFSVNNETVVHVYVENRTATTVFSSSKELPVSVEDGKIVVEFSDIQSGYMTVVVENFSCNTDEVSRFKCLFEVAE